MWNYNFILPSLLIQAVILPFYMFRPRLKIRFNRSFSGVMIFQTLTILFDYLSSRADEAYASVPIPVLYALNMAFFVCFMLRAFYFFLVTVDILMLSDQARGKIFNASFILLDVLLAVTLSSFVTGAVFYINETGYHSGTLYRIIYVCGFSYVLLSLGILLKESRRLKRYEAACLFGFNLILLLGYIMRLTAPKYLIMNTFCLMAIFVIYIGFTNPDLYRSDRGAFNMKAFTYSLDEYKNTHYRILSFILCDYNDKRGVYGGMQIDRGIEIINTYLMRTFPKATVFYLRNGCFALLGPSSMDVKGMYHTIWKRFEEAWTANETDLYLDATFIQASRNAEKESVDQIETRLLSALEHASHDPSYLTLKDEPDTVSIIDQEVGVKRALEMALDRDEVEVFLQPLYDARTESIIAAEALCRIRDEQGKLISPAIFIPIAEQNGYISQLGEDVFRKTCMFIRDHPLDSLGMVWINVNLSPIQCMSNELAPSLAKILRETGVDANQIHLEITEESMVDYSLLEKQIHALQNEGFQFALDDYGSGYSNLTRVKHYPFSNIKLDMELVRDYFAERDFLVPSLVETFKKMGVTITAEGIETGEMAKVFTEIGCDYLQGYCYSKPIPMDEFLKKYGKE